MSRSEPEHQSFKPRQPSSALSPPMVLVVLAAFAMPLLAACDQRETLTVKASRSSGETPAVTTAPPDSAKLQVWFVHAKDGKLDYVPCERTVAGKDALVESVEALLAGPTQEETMNGIASEIPKGTTLTDVKNSDEGVELNLSKSFASDGGSESIESRLEQLNRTVSAVVRDRKVFLNVDGKRLTETPGEGIEVRQPINL